METKLLRLAILSAAGVYASTAVAIEPAGVSAGPVDLIPTLTVQTGYNDNLYGDETGEKGTFFSVISPNLQAIAEKDNDSYTVNYNMAIGTMYSSHVDDYVDHNLTGTAALELDSRNRLTLGANLGRIHESGPNNGDAPAYFLDKGVSAGYGFGAEGAQGNLEGTFAYQSHDTLNYDSTNAGDVRENLLLGGKFLYRVAPKTRAVAELRFEDVDYELSTSTLDSFNTKVLGGVAWDATAKTSGEAKIGFAKKDFDSSSRSDQDGLTWEIGATWAPRTYSTVSLATSQSFAESGGDGEDAKDTKSYSVSWDHKWSELVSTQAGYSLTQEEYLGTARDDSTNAINVGVTYELQRWLSLGLGYSFSDTDSNSAGDSSTNNQVVLTLQGSL